MTTARRRLAHSLSIAFTLALSAALPSAGPVAASCQALQVPGADTPDTAVFVGTVRALDPIRTELVVDGWFLGTGPSDVVVVLGGRDPNVITSADWMPSVGQQYVVGAARTPEGSLVTDLCQQGLLTPELLAVLQATYGDPQLPPFPIPSPSPSAWPSASPVVAISPSPGATGPPPGGPGEQGPSLALPALGLLVLFVGAAIALARRRRP